MSRRAWVRLASCSCHCSHVMPVAAARGANASRMVLLSGIAHGRRPTTRTPCGASSADSPRVSASIAAMAGP